MHLHIFNSIVLQLIHANLDVVNMSCLCIHSLLIHRNATFHLLMNLKINFLFSSHLLKSLDYDHHAGSGVEPILIFRGKLISKRCRDFFSYNVKQYDGGVPLWGFSGVAPLGQILVVKIFSDFLCIWFIVL
ncbi:hypothetical protein KFK09_024755 [Dendrobium nobile]|uniref:Uncharacterized protein n=1 Tax=Dendrobium nobile TaxID=94219 RepID=A0A8T3AEY2_DENNO|nr:hypothetical protein KFK09_024755 [Dendrobium nobile]